MFSVFFDTQSVDVSINRRINQVEFEKQNSVTSANNVKSNRKKVLAHPSDRRRLQK